MATEVIASFSQLTRDGDSANGRRSSANGRRPSAVAIGFFDGVHVGHQALVCATIDAARARGLRSVVLTFANHPATVVRPQAAPKLITSREQRVALLRRLSPDVLCVVPFDNALSQWEPRRFCEEVLRDAAATRRLTVGRNFVLGRGRSGTVPVLESLGAELGFEVVPFEPVEREGLAVSSSEIRAQIAAGRVERAAAFLGRPFSVTGIQIGGNRLGRELGFPTLNLHVADELLLPATGIYAARARLAGETFDAAVYLGARATFGGGAASFEVHLLGFSGEADPGPVTIELLSRVRDDARFASAAELARQIGADVAEVRRRLREYRAPGDREECRS